MQKMEDQGRSDFYVVFTTSHCALGLKTIVNKFAISNHTALILGVHALRRYLKLIVNMSFIDYQIKQSVVQRIMVKTTLRSERSWSTTFA